MKLLIVIAKKKKIKLIYNLILYSDKYFRKKINFKKK